MNKSKDLNPEKLSLEILTESKEFRRVDGKRQIIISPHLRKEMNIKPEDTYIELSVCIESDGSVYNGARGILVLPVNVNYTLIKYTPNQS